MKLIPELLDTEANREFRRFFSNIPRKSWKQKLAKIRSLPRLGAPSANAYINHLANMNPLTRDIGIFLKVESRGELIRNYLTPELMKTCGYLRIINAIFDKALPGAAEKIRSILLDDETVRSFLFEVDVATHFLLAVLMFNLSIYKARGISIFWCQTVNTNWKSSAKLKVRMRGERLLDRIFICFVTC